MATGGTVTVLRRGQFSRFSTEQGLSYYFATSLLEDAEGNVWVTTGRGLNRIRDGAITSFAGSEGLPPASLMGAVAQDASPRGGAAARVGRPDRPVHGDRR